MFIVVRLLWKESQCLNLSCCSCLAAVLQQLFNTIMSFAMSFSYGLETQIQLSITPSLIRLEMFCSLYGLHYPISWVETNRGVVVQCICISICIVSVDHLVCGKGPTAAIMSCETNGPLSKHLTLSTLVMIIGTWQSRGRHFSNARDHYRSRSIYAGEI